MTATKTIVSTAAATLAMAVATLCWPFGAEAHYDPDLGLNVPVVGFVPFSAVTGNDEGEDAEDAQSEARRTDSRKRRPKHRGDRHGSHQRRGPKA